MLSNTRKLVMIAILSALSFVLLFFNFPIIPGADFLKIDFSIIPILFALVLFDLKSGLWVLLIRSLLKLILDNQGANTYIGLPMNIVALGLFLVSFAIIWKKHRGTVSYIIASIVATIVLTVAMVFLNFIYAIPLYAKFANFDIGKFIGIGKYLFGMVVPFNIVEGIILSVAFYIIYLACRSLLERHKQ